jgi:hypothetical protein
MYLARAQKCSTGNEVALLIAVIWISPFGADIILQRKRQDVIDAIENGA